MWTPLRKLLTRCDRWFDAPTKNKGAKSSFLTFNAVVSSTLLGSADFIKHIKDNFLSGKKPDKELPALKELVEKVSMHDIFDAVESVFSKEKVLARNVKIYF
jgi:hypothetical protein